MAQLLIRKTKNGVALFSVDNLLNVPMELVSGDELCDIVETEEFIGMLARMMGDGQLLIELTRL